MTVLVIAVHIVVVVFPILRACIVGGIYINTIYLARVEIAEQLESVIVIRLDERMPEITVRRVLYGVDGREIGVDRIAKLRYSDKFLHGDVRGFSSRALDAVRSFAIDFFNTIELLQVSLPGCQASWRERNVIERRPLRQMLLEDEAEFLLLACSP